MVWFFLGTMFGLLVNNLYHRRKTKRIKKELVAAKVSRLTLQEFQEQYPKLYQTVVRQAKEKFYASDQR